ncbi:hypothetical protein ACIP2X_33195 [Streptomyces sp. NPDC089424]|uniref:hypothetical protein n=1 Tax=Streptomyces sp. NPDC089424 TaxID=3365917 RepID=UPI0037FC303E
MRGLPARRLASSALCAALVLGIAAPVAVAADHDSARSRTSTPVPGAEDLIPQIEYLAGLDPAFAPVADLLDTVLTAEGGQLTEDQATALEDSVQEAIEEFMAEMSATTPSTVTPAPSAAPSTPQAPSLPAAPSAPAVPSAPGTPAAPTPAATLPATSVPATTLPAPVDDDIDMPSADVTEDTISELEKLIDELLDAATSGVAGEVVPAATDVITGLLDLLTDLLAAAGLPVPSLPVEASAS